MKNKLFGLYAAGLLAIAASNASAVAISLDPASAVVSAGTPLEVAVKISGLGNGAAPSLGAFDLDVLFDPAVLAFSSGTFGDPVFGDQLDLFLGFGCFAPFDCDFTDNGAGVLNMFELSLDPVAILDTLQLGAFTLATITFDPLPGVVDVLTSLSLSNVILADAQGNALAVPEPTTLLLLAAGLLGVGFMRLHGAA